MVMVIVNKSNIVIAIAVNMRITMIIKDINIHDICYASIGTTFLTHTQMIPNGADTAASWSRPVDADFAAEDSLSTDLFDMDGQIF
jgi:hypothetical protein